MTTALIPVKRLEHSKSRLLPQLPDGDRQALTLAMLEDLIEALQATPGLDRIAVTTPDPAVAERASRAGAQVLMRPQPGLNAALEEGRARLRAAMDPEEALLIVLGDVAGALPKDLARLLAAASPSDPPDELQHEGAALPSGVWLAPSSDGGTSALLQRPADLIPCCFGRDSAKRHREAAAAAGAAYHELTLPSLAIDLDAPEDLEAFLATRGGGRRTRRLLASLPRRRFRRSPNV
jgi:2-phospho-L-lactate guanylyltransferase